MQNIRREILEFIHGLQFELIEEICYRVIELKSLSKPNTPSYKSYGYYQPERFNHEHIRKFDKYELGDCEQVEQFKFHRCLGCGKNRSGRPLRKGAEIVEQLVCRRATCAMFKLFMKDILNSSDVFIQINHNYYNNNTLETTSPINTVELPGESKIPTDRIELPGEGVDWTLGRGPPSSQIHLSREDVQPFANFSTKPSARLVEKVSRQKTILRSIKGEQLAAHRR
jgi:hypothetical protein